jgi:hypothetical protein
MVEVVASRQAYNTMIITNTVLIKSCYNPADGLTKVGCNPALANLLRTHSIDNPVDQFVLRKFNAEEA